MADHVRIESCSVTRAGGSVRCVGDVDETNAAEVADRLTAEIRSGAVDVDLSGVGYFGAAGVQALMQGWQALPPGATLQVSCSPVAFRVLQVCGLVGVDGLVVARVDAYPGVQG